MMRRNDVGSSGLASSLRGLLDRALSSVTRIPLFFWIYLGVILYLYKRVSRDWLGIGTKRKLLLNRLHVDLTKEEEAIAEGVIDPVNIKESFAEIGGLDDIKQAVTEHIVWPFTRPDLFPEGSLRSHPTGLLLYGPPGTGKTLIARALAKELNGFFIEVCVEKMFAKWVGESEKLAAAVFSLAAKLQPCVVFVDEIDSLLGTRNNSDSAVYTHAKTIFMTKWDGLQQGGGGGGGADSVRQRIIVVGATNRPRSLDDAILRRMPIRLEVPLPSEDARATIIRIHLDGELRRIDSSEAERLVRAVAGATSGYSGSDLKELCKAACMVPLRQLMQASPRGQISTPSKASCAADVPTINISHFWEAIQKVRATSAF